MKGGKGGRVRRAGSGGAKGKPTGGQTAPKGGKQRSEAPKKGEPKKSFGWRSSRDD